MATIVTPSHPFIYSSMDGARASNEKPIEVFERRKLNERSRAIGACIEKNEAECPIYFVCVCVRERERGGEGGRGREREREMSHEMSIMHIITVLAV